MKNTIRKKYELIEFGNGQMMHDWFLKNHFSNPGIWIVFYKKSTGKGGITHQEALDEALCFGWIDSTIKSLDQERYAIKFTPRKNISLWSDLNKRKVLELIKKGRMQEAGLKKIDVYIKTGKVEWPVE